jgi:hypothetical protein
MSVKRDSFHGVCIESMCHLLTQPSQKRYDRTHGRRAAGLHHERGKAWADPKYGGSCHEHRCPFQAQRPYQLTELMLSMVRNGGG